MLTSFFGMLRLTVVWDINNLWDENPAVKMFILSMLYRKQKHIETHQKM